MKDLKKVEFLKKEVLGITENEAYLLIAIVRWRSNKDFDINKYLTITTMECAQAMSGLVGHGLLVPNGVNGKLKFTDSGRMIEARLATFSFEILREALIAYRNNQ